MSDIKLLIGIDPDIDKCGYAVWDAETKELDINKHNVAEILQDLTMWNIPFYVFLEAGWLIKKSNWHNEKQSAHVSSTIGKKVGMNHGAGIVIEQFLKLHNIPYELVKPQGKLSHENFKKITKYVGRTNSEMRDSAMLVFGRNVIKIK